MSKFTKLPKFFNFSFYSKLKTKGFPKEAFVIK